MLQKYVTSIEISILDSLEASLVVDVEIVFVLGAIVVVMGGSSSAIDDRSLVLALAKLRRPFFTK